MGENEQCKVSDFGLFRVLPPDDDDDDDDDGETYVWHDRTVVPLRWLAPESIQHRKFSSASDVWSFGVVQWEMYFPTRLPYDDLLDNVKCAVEICSGHRLSIPVEYPPVIQRIMKACWNSEPEKRPSFLLISSLLTNLTE